MNQLLVGPKHQIIYFINTSCLLCINIFKSKMITKKSEGPKTWKSNQEKYGTATKKAAEECEKMTSSNIFHTPISQNNFNNDKQNSKALQINRHFSEKSFKKYMRSNYPNNYHPSYVKAQEEYFPDSPCQIYKPAKPISTNQKPNLNYKPNFNDKKKPQIISIKTNNLKQTSSTQSAENLGYTRSVPEFVRTKIMKNDPSQYSNPRIFTPRNNLKRENFKIISKLGEGKFGKVFLVKELYSGFILAMKIVEKKKIVKDGLLEQFIRELRIQSFLNHPNIISLYGFFTDDTHFYTLMELGCDGQLFSLTGQNKILSQQTTSYIVKNLLEAIGYIHANKVLHRDIKPENIVLIMGNVKICDFGWAVNKMHPGDLRNTFCGTPLYLSPQIIQGSHYNQKVDLWAIGVLAFELYLGCTPFDITDPNDLYRIVTDSIKFPQNKTVSPQFKEFISAMLCKNPSERLTSKRLLEMDFITKYKDFQTCEELCR